MHGNRTGEYSILLLLFVQNSSYSVFPLLFCYRAKVGSRMGLPFLWCYKRVSAFAPGILTLHHAIFVFMAADKISFR